jgi:hypothetical protein
VKLAFGSFVVACLALFVGGMLMPPTHAQIGSFSGWDPPPALLRGVCFATVDNQSRHFRVEEVRNGWIRIATAVDKIQVSSFVRVESRWLNAATFREIVTLSGP